MNFKFLIGKDDTIRLNLEFREVFGDVTQLNTQWNPHFIQDLEIYRNINIDISAELYEILRNEIDNIIMEDLRRMLVPRQENNNFKFLR